MKGPMREARRDLSQASPVIADCHPAVRILVICLLRNRDLRWAHSTQAGGRWRLGPTS